MNNKLVPCVFDADFWDGVVARLWADARGDWAALRSHVVIVPDASMYVPWSGAWAAHARALDAVCVMPRMMTLLDWAKSHGASDWDAKRVERTLAWMMQLQNTPQLLTWLAGSDDADVFGIAGQMVALSDELSLHFLARADVGAGEAALRGAVDEVYDAQAGIAARQELAVLLQCWRADVASHTPVVRYLAVLEQMLHSKPSLHVSVIRNQTWSRHEEWFWSAYGGVTVFDVQQVRALADVSTLHRAWPVAQARIVPPAVQGIAHAVRMVLAPHIEDEAQAVVRQVLAWRAAGVPHIGLVALDRTVSRRVAALLGRVGVAMRDDTGWLLSTARAASSWQAGFDLWAGEVECTALLDWLAHPMVWVDCADKSSVLREIKQLALQSHSVLRSWQDWLNCARNAGASDEVCSIFTTAQQHVARFARPKGMAQWVAQVEQWAIDFNMWNAWQNDAAGRVWLQLLEHWRGVASESLNFGVFLCVVQSEVEQATFRAFDVGDSVLLLPLGSTRMRDFDAVWLMGADVDNFPNRSVNAGLLNVGTRHILGLPTHLNQQQLAQCDLMDLISRTPMVRASYCASKNGAPNALSPWLMQYVRAAQTAVLECDLPQCSLTPRVAERSQAVIAHVPDKISATDVQSLVACPYQFYTRKTLGLKQYRFADDDIGAADKGSLWHEIVVDFHHMRVLEATREQDVSTFMQCIEQHLSGLCTINPRYWVVREVFMGYVAAYVNWWRARESAGWRVLASEDWKVVPNDGVQWQGKIDQIDVRDYTDAITGEVRQEYALIDYKTGSLKSYQKQISTDTDIQLAFYVNLNLDVPLIQAGYIGVTHDAFKLRKDEKPHQGDNHYPQLWLNPSQTTHDTEPLQRLAGQLKQQINTTFAAIRSGEPLVAMGSLSACQYCVVRGLCRKGYVNEGVAS